MRDFKVGDIVRGRLTGALGEIVGGLYVEFEDRIACYPLARCDVELVEPADPPVPQPQFNVGDRVQHTQDKDGGRVIEMASPREIPRYRVYWDSGETAYHSEQFLIPEPPEPPPPQFEVGDIVLAKEVKRYGRITQAETKYTIQYLNNEAESLTFWTAEELERARLCPQCGQPVPEEKHD